MMVKTKNQILPYFDPMFSVLGIGLVEGTPLQHFSLSSLHLLNSIFYF